MLCSHSFINCLKLDMFSFCNLHCRWTHVLTVNTRGMKHKSAHTQLFAASACYQWNCWDKDLGDFLPPSFDFQWYLAVETGEWQQSNDSQHCRPHQINLTCGANAQMQTAYSTRLYFSGQESPAGGPSCHSTPVKQSLSSRWIVLTILSTSSS